MLVKVKVGEWINVYHDMVGWVELPDDQEINETNVKNAIEENGVDIEKEDLDWTTEDHEKWDFEGLKILETQKD